MKRREKILKAASRLFAEQGFDGTTTYQIAKQAGVTEPLIFYHFKGKDWLFTAIIESVFAPLFTQLDTRQEPPLGPFEKIERIIDVHFMIVQEMPYEAAAAIRTCPAKLKDSAHVCAEYLNGWRDRLKSNLTDCLTEGIESGEFIDVPIQETVNMLIALINGLIRQQIWRIDTLTGVKDATVAFIRRSLVRQ